MTQPNLKWLCETRLILTSMLDQWYVLGLPCHVCIAVAAGTQLHLGMEGGTAYRYKENEMIFGFFIIFYTTQCTTPCLKIYFEILL